MRIPVLDIRFDSAQLENEFRQRYRAAHRLHNIVAAIVGLSIYAFFGILDQLVSPDGWQQLWQLRFGFTFPLMLAIAALQFSPWGRRLAGPVIFVLMLLAGNAIVMMNLRLPPGAENLYFTGLLLVIVFGHVFWYAQYLWPLAASLLIFAWYLVMTLGKVAPALIVTAIFYYLTVVVILAYSGWYREWQERRAFMLQHELRQRATTDSLTGIANRRAFREHLEVEWRRARREGRLLCLLLVDLDRMKQINDSGGHAMGDEALRQVARELKALARRPGDMAARVGGDEFVLLLVGGQPEAACELARDIAGRPLLLAGGGDAALPFELTVSVGVACLVAGEDESCENLIRLADQALYRAKHQGRARAVCQEMENRAESLEMMR